jgi:PAS domain S-box-containing protein
VQKSVREWSIGNVVAGTLILSALPLVAVEILPGFKFVLARSSYLLFHNTAEFFSVMVSLSMFGIGWYSYGQSKNRHTLFLSTAFIAIGLMDFMHTLANAAMPPFLTPNSSNKSTQFWIAVRLFQAVAFLVSAYVYSESSSRWLSRKVLMPSVLLICFLVFTGVTFFPAYVPATFVPGVGLTAFKKISEYLVIGLLCAAVVAYWRRIARTGDRMLIYYLAAFVICIFSELSLAVYTRVFDTYNVLGHIYKVAAFFLIYYGIYRASIKAPYFRLAEVSEKLQQARNNLELRVEERTAELAQSNAQLRKEIEDRRKAEEALREAHDRALWLARFPDENPNPVIRVSEDGSILYFNDSAGELPGWTGDIGQPLDYRLMPVVKKALAGGQEEEEDIEIGSRVYSVLAVPFSEEHYANVYGRDITERKRAEEALRQKEEEFRTLVENAPDVISLFDRNLRRLYVNSKVRENTGQDASFMIGKSLTEAGYPDSFTLPLNAKLQNVFATGSAETIELEYEAPKGRTWFQIRCAPLRTADGSVERVMSIGRDITERKQIEETLQRSEAVYRSIATNFPNGAVYVFDRDMRFLVADGAAIADIGWSRDKLEGMCVGDLDEETRRIIEPRYHRVLAGESLRFETPYHGRIMFSDYVPIKDEAGQVIMGMVVSTDITERKLAEEKLLETQTRTAAILKGIADTFYSLDDKWRFTVVNPAAEQAPFGRPAAELLGRVIWELYPGLVGTRIHRHYLDAAEKHTLEHYVAQSPLNGRWYEVFMQGWKGGVDVYMRDITDRKRMEEELRESERRERERAAELMTILDAVPTPVFIVHDPDGVHITGNRAADNLLRQPRGAEASLSAPEEIRPRHFRAVKDGRELSNEELPAQRAAHGVQVQDFEFSLVFDDGTVRHMMGYGTPLEDEQKRLRGAVHVLVDITQRRQMEEDLRKSRDELELRVKERTAELELRNKELQDFAFVASHDLQEPLRKVQTFGNMLVAKCSVSLDQISRDYIDRMQKAAGRMQSLLNSLLSYSRVTTRADPMKKTELRRCVKEALSNLEIVRGEKNAVVGIGDLPTVKVDPVQMAQLFQNLIGNALKFHRDGEAPHVKIHAKEVGDTYEIYVEDNGIGFDEKYLDKIFLPFQRLQGRSSNYEGVGMGLAICKKIVERHGGNITARSEPGKGSTFIVTLPANRKVP